MSEINKALAELASQKSQPAQLQRAELPKVTSVKPIVWIATGFGLSLAVGGWAITQSAPVSQNYSEPVTTTVVTVAEEALRSPTQKNTIRGSAKCHCFSAEHRHDCASGKDNICCSLFGKTSNSAKQIGNNAGSESRCEIIGYGQSAGFSLSTKPSEGSSPRRTKYASGGKQHVG